MTHLPTLGVYGFDSVEPLIFAALVTEDPLLLIGKSGTGKTFLLNSLSEALGLEHRHYNASLISFDDLVGFPYPDNEAGGVKFLQTPATVWSAESVLVDEISRCKPEHQNRLFSLVHERRVQGIRLERLRFRWAAMNPCTTDQNADDGYAGSEPLDPALGDRFGLIVTAADWNDLREHDRKRIADPAGEGCIAADGGWLGDRLRRWRAEFERAIEQCPSAVVDYVTAAVTTLNQNSVRVSPRRARFITRSLVALEIVSGTREERLYELALGASMPHASWGVRIDPLAIKAAHKAAWELALADSRRKWIQQFHLAGTLDAKLELLLNECSDPDVATQAVCELLSREPKAKAAAFAFAVYPAAAAGLRVIGREGVNELGKWAMPILDVDGTISWQERLTDADTSHPDLADLMKVVSTLRGARKQRARQFFSWSLVEGLVITGAPELEAELDRCVRVMKQHVEKVAA